MDTNAFSLVKYVTARATVPERYVLEPGFPTDQASMQ